MSKKQMIKTFKFPLKSSTTRHEEKKKREQTGRDCLIIALNSIMEMESK